MSKVLVAYGTKSGSTAEVAEAVGRALAETGLEVEVRRAGEVQSIAEYAAVVLGGPVVSPAWHPHAIDFLRRFHAMLARMPVAYFVTSMTLTWTADGHVGSIPIFQDPAHARAPRRAGKLGFAEKRRTPEAYLTPVLRQAPDVVPVHVAFLAGKLDYGTLDLVTRTLIKAVFRMAPGDSRNWAAIRSWARGLRAALVPGEEQPRAAA